MTGFSKLIIGTTVALFAIVIIAIMFDDGCVVENSRFGKVISCEEWKAKLMRGE